VFIYAAVKYHHFTLRKKDWALGLIVLTLAPFMYGLSRGFEQLYSRMDLANEDLGPASGRLQIWEFVLNHLWINPITGVGLGNFRVVPGSDSTPSNMHPHNFVLQFMLETGLIGSLIAAAITLYLLWLFRGYARGNIYGAAGLAAAVAFFTSSLANTSIFNAWWLMFIVVPCIIGWRVGWSAAVAPKQPTTFVRDDRPILRGRLGLSDSL
jgi:O-antigen ligase